MKGGVSIVYIEAEDSIGYARPKEADFRHHYSWSSLFQSGLGDVV
jgi:hypothetical protein